MLHVASGLWTSVFTGGGPGQTGDVLDAQSSVWTATTSAVFMVSFVEHPEIPLQSVSLCEELGLMESSFSND